VCRNRVDSERAVTKGEEARKHLGNTLRTAGGASLDLTGSESDRGRDQAVWWQGPLRRRRGSLARSGGGSPLEEVNARQLVDSERAVTKGEEARKHLGNTLRTAGGASLDPLIRIEDEIKQSGGKVRYAGAEGLSRGPEAAPLSNRP
jgi:hypothetical protein